MLTLRLLRPASHMPRPARRIYFTPVYYKHGSDWILSKALNISRHGACLLVKNLLSPGEDINLEIPHKGLTANEILSIRGEVRWVRESFFHHSHYECGVVFRHEDIKYRRTKQGSFQITDLNCLFLQHYSRHCTGKTASNLEELKEAYKILYQEYLTSRLCEENDARLYYNFFSLIPETRTFILKRKGDILGTISLVPDSPCGLPMEATYPNEIADFRAKGMRLAEVGCIALNSKFFPKTGNPLKDIKKQAHLFKLFKTMWDYARYMTNTTDLILGCHPRHAILYKYLNFEEAAQVRRHQAVKGAPAVLMKFNIEDVVRNNTLLKEGPGRYFLKKCDSIASIKEHFPWTSQTVHHFLHHLRPLWETLSTEQRQYITKVYSSI